MIYAIGSARIWYWCLPNVECKWPNALSRPNLVGVPFEILSWGRVTPPVGVPMKHPPYRVSNEHRIEPPLSPPMFSGKHGKHIDDIPPRTFPDYQDAHAGWNPICTLYLTLDDLVLGDIVFKI